MHYASHHCFMHRIGVAGSMNYPIINPVNIKNMCAWSTIHMCVTHEICMCDAWDIRKSILDAFNAQELKCR